MQPQFNPRLVDSAEFSGLLQFYHAALRRIALRRNAFKLSLGNSSCASACEEELLSEADLMPSSMSNLHGLIDQQEVFFNKLQKAAALSFPQLPNLRAAIISNGDGASPRGIQQARSIGHEPFRQRRFALFRTGLGNDLPHSVPKLPSSRQVDDERHERPEDGLDEEGRRALLACMPIEEVERRRASGLSLIDTRATENELRSTLEWVQESPRLVYVNIDDEHFLSGIFTALGDCIPDLTELALIRGRKITPATDFRASSIKDSLCTKLSLRLLEFTIGVSNSDDSWRTSTWHKAVLPLLRHVCYSSILANQNRLSAVA